MQSAGTNVISRFTSGKPTYTPNPQLQNSFAERMANTIASPALSLERAKRK